jgi:hypothetical protein
MVTVALRSSYVSFSCAVTVSVWVPATPLAGETESHEVDVPTLAVHAALVVKVMVAVPAFCSTTGSEPLISILLLSGLGVGVGIGPSSPPELQLQQQTISNQSKKCNVFFIIMLIFIFPKAKVEQPFCSSKPSRYFFPFFLYFIFTLSCLTWCHVV